MALSAWGLWSDELDAIELDQLARAYMRRKQWEAKLLGVEIAKLFAPSTKAEPPAKTVSADEMFALMGVTVKGG